MYCSCCSGSFKNKLEIKYCAQCNVPIHETCANHCMKCGKILCDYCSLDNHFMCDECASKEKKEHEVTRIRRSYIEQYKHCHYSLYLQLVKGHIPPMGSYAEVGVIVHQIIDKISEHDQSLEDSILELEREINEFNTIYQDEYSHVSEAQLENGRQCLRNFYQIKDKFNVGRFESEKNIVFKIREDLPEVSCTLDRIMWDEEGIHIHDWKTGKPMAGKKLVEDLQPGLYIEAVHKEYGEYPKSFTLHYISVNKDITYTRVSDKEYQVVTKRNTYTLSIDNLLDGVVKLLESIKNEDYNMPNPYENAWYCDNMCWFKKAGLCGGNIIEGWKTLNEEIVQ